MTFYNVNSLFLKHKIIFKILNQQIMAKNGKTGDGHRNGAVKERTQTFNPKTETWVKRDSETGRFMDGKSDGTPFKGVTKEKK